LTCSARLNDNLLAPFREIASHFLDTNPAFWFYSISVFPHFFSH
jgi:hypothetical protein